MTLQQKHKAAAEQSKDVIAVLCAHLMVQAKVQCPGCPRLPDDFAQEVESRVSKTSVKLAKKLLVELLPKTYAVPKAPRKRARR
jgi:hypothetical protein